MGNSPGPEGIERRPLSRKARRRATAHGLHCCPRRARKPPAVTKPPVVTKHFINAETLLAESFRLAALVHASGYRPELILGVWRGGAPIAIAVHEYFAFRGHCCEHLPVRVSSYTGIDEQAGQIAIHGLPGLIAELACHQRLLIVDDVVDSGRSLTALLAALRSDGTDRELRTA